MEACPGCGRRVHLDEVLRETRSHRRVLFSDNSCIAEHDNRLGLLLTIIQKWPCEHKSKITKNLRVCDRNHCNNILNILFTCSSLLEKILNVICSANKFSSSAVWEPVWTCWSVVSHILLLPLTRICLKIEACYSEIICGTKPELPHSVIQKLP